MKELLSGIIGPVTNIIDKVVLDKDEAARLAHEISTMADRHVQELALAQVKHIPSHRTDCDCDGRHDRCFCQFGWGMKNDGLSFYWSSFHYRAPD